MIYKEIVENLHPLDASWEKLKSAVQKLEEALPDHSSRLRELQESNIEPGLKKIRAVRETIEKDPTPAQALGHATTFLSNEAAPGTDEAVNLETRTVARWELIHEELTPAQRQRRDVAAINDLIKKIGTARTTSLQNITQMQVDSVGLAATNLCRTIATGDSSVAGAIEDVTTYPVLTQEVGYAPSPLAMSAGSPAGTGTTNLGATVSKAINDVLGWKSKTDDNKGFLGALNASFTCEEIEGRTECKWTPRSYAVATDLAGGITGAQASIYTRAKEALDLALPLLDGLYSLNITSNLEDVEALKKVARSQMTELVSELGLLGGPRTSRVSQYFNLLLGVPPFMTRETKIEPEPDFIAGTLGTLRDLLGLSSRSNKFVNSVEDEQNVTNYRILSDYITSLAQSWVNSLDFFQTPTPKGAIPFFGTRLVQLSRQLSVIAESVDQVRFAMDSVFIGPAERQTLSLVLELPDVTGDYSIYVEDLLSWVSSFALEEGPRLIQDGGKYAVGLSFKEQTNTLHLLTSAEINRRKSRLPDAFFISRVTGAWKQLRQQIEILSELCDGVEHDIESADTRVLTPILQAAEKAQRAHQSFPSQVEEAIRQHFSSLAGEEIKVGPKVPVSSNEH